MKCGSDVAEVQEKVALAPRGLGHVPEEPTASSLGGALTSVVESTVSSSRLSTTSVMMLS